MPVIMGTAGHIDHGKTALIRALSGIDCDRLSEEKKRGITIELGFAFLDGFGEQKLGIVDVPGHEKFVKNMVSGAAGIDFVLLVVAADEGVMPQTREHLEICSLLGIEHGLVAITKLDMVDDELLELVLDDVQDYLQDTFLEEAPIIPVSAHTGAGLDELKEALTQTAEGFATHRRADLFRLPVDRVFSMRGHGTVITGTTVSGKVRVGEEVMVYPEGLKTKVRSIQVHGEQREESSAGMRTAINLHSVDVEALERGFVLAHPGTLFPSPVWDLELTYLKSAAKPLRHRTEVHFHHGSKEIMARIYLLDRDKLEAGETCMAQVRFKTPMAGVYGDRCVLRSFSPLRTIAGARIINPVAGKVKRFSPEVEELGKMAHATGEELIAMQLKWAGPRGLSLPQLKIMTDMEGKALEKALQTMGGRQEALVYDRENRVYVSGEIVRELCAKLLEYVANYHRQNPLRHGVSRGELTSAWAQGLPDKLVHFLLERLLKSGELINEQQVLRLPEHKVSLAADQEKLRSRILEEYTSAGLEPPTVKQLLEKLDLKPKEAEPVLRLLAEKRELIKINADFYFSPQAVDKLKGMLRDYFSRNEEMGPMDFKELTGLSRKFAIPLLEFMDKEKLTMRVGDKRKLRSR
jgi:selenocysteine-specific elongation factor